MSKQLSALDQVLIDTIQKTTNAVGEVTAKTIDFASAQIPDVVKQLLEYNLIECISLSICYIFLIVLFFKGYFYFDKKVKEDVYNDDLGLFFYTMIGGAIAVLLSIGTVLNILEAIKIYVAPKLYLLEYVAHLIK